MNSKSALKEWSDEELVQLLEDLGPSVFSDSREVRDASLVITEWRERGGAIGRRSRRLAISLISRLKKRADKELGSMSDTMKRNALRRGDQVVIVETYGNGHVRHERAATVRKTTRHAAKVRFEDGTERMVHYKDVLLKTEPENAPPPEPPASVPAAKPKLRVIRPDDPPATVESPAQPKEAPMAKKPQRTTGADERRDIPEPRVAFGNCPVATTAEGVPYSPTRVGPFVRAVRKAKGEYQWQTGAAWQVKVGGQGLVSSIERSARIPTDDELIMIAEWGCPFEWGGTEVILETLIAWRDRDAAAREEWIAGRRRAGGKHAARTKTKTRSRAPVEDVTCIYSTCANGGPQASSPDVATCNTCIERWLAEEAPKPEVVLSPVPPQAIPPAVANNPKPQAAAGDMFRIEFFASGTKVRAVSVSPERWAMLLDLAAEEAKG